MCYFIPNWQVLGALAQMFADQVCCHVTSGSLNLEICRDDNMVCVN